MKFKTLLTASFIFFLLSSSAAFAQHLVLFETFTNNCDPCPDALRPAFDDAVKTVLSNESSKIIYLNYHVINLCDPLNASEASGATMSVDQRLTGGNTLYDGAVDRVDFGSGHASGTGTDWSTEIEQEAGKSAPATITLTSATLDKTSNGTSYKLRATTTVTASQGIPDNINIFFAVVQDGITLPSGTTGVCTTNPGSEPLGPYNSVVLYITSGTGTPVFTGGTTAGTSKQITFSQSIANSKGDPLFDWSKMKLIAFIEESSNATNYHVVNAVNLRQDLDTLQPPPPMLTLTDSLLNGMTFHPGLIQPISFSSANLIHGVNAFFSSDNGNSWNVIADSQYSPINWTVDSNLTTQGKIKLVSVDYPTLVSTESGTFTIAKAPSLSFVRPAPGEILHADSAYTFEWTKFSVGGVKLLYAYANQSGGFPKFDTIADHITDTFYHWTVPDTNIIVEFQLVPDSNEAVPTSVIDTIKKLFPNGVVPNSMASDGLSITSVFPNPAASGEDMIVQFTESRARPVTLQVLDLLGHIVGQFYPMANQAVHLDTRALASGSYIVRLSDGVGVVSKRVEIMR